MACAIQNAIRTFEKEGLKDQAVRYLEKHPDSVDHLTMNELREQIVMHPDAQPHAVAGKPPAPVMAPVEADSPALAAS